jgi:hypothetical protein
MKITYCENKEIDFKQFRTYADLLNFIDDLPPEDKIDFQGRVLDNPDDTLFVEYDHLTKKEIAVLNLCIALDNERTRLQNKLFPKGDRVLEALTEFLAPGKKVEKTPVEASEFAIYQQIALASNLIHNYFQYNLYNRIGFDVSVMYGADGKISALKDLRNFYS